MSPSNTLPSLLVFGSVTEFPPAEILEGLRLELISNPHLSALKYAVDKLPKFWNTLVDFDKSLYELPGPGYLSQLSQWVKEGGSFPYHHSRSPNLYALPVIILLQISQYMRYLGHLGHESHCQVLESIKGGGIQGFCVGFISAVAVASSTTEADIGNSAAVGLRLALCIGAYVDKDNIQSNDHEGAGCVAIRWKGINTNEREVVNTIIQSYPEAYVSSINDNRCVSVTLKASDLNGLAQIARGHGFRTTIVPVNGRFHTSDNFQASRMLTELVSRTESLRFPADAKLNAPLRSTIDGEITGQGSLIRLVIDNTLLKRADWYATMNAAVHQLPQSNKTVAIVGFIDPIPSSLVQDASLQVFNLGELDGGSAKKAESPLHITSFPNGSGDFPEYPPHSIAITGMAGRFPGADSVDELWQLLLEGKIMAEPAPVERFQLPQSGNYADTKWWGNFLRDPESFDHRFFKKSSREAISWDPQQRILLEVIYQALESAGHFGPSSTKETKDYGCYIGAVMNNYYDNISSYSATAYSTLGTSRCFLSGCMSHYFGWTGPSLTIDTACSSSLVAINTACRAIWSGECSRAVAGGTNVITSPFDYQNLHAAGFLSPTGQCKPFDADADGYCRGEGVAVVVLKPLSDAIKDSDNILGVIIGSAANQNHNFSHITVPHSGSQIALFQKAMRLGNVKPEHVSYIEAHGTGTGVGDPVEINSIREAFGGPQRDSILHFASIKGNIGHTEATAGIAGLVKVLLMMRDGKIPKQASHNVLNPKISRFDMEQMAIPRSVMPWNPSTRFACINSYGAAGSNAAVIVREKPPLRALAAAPQLSMYPLVLSAKSLDSLSMYGRKLLNWLEDDKSTTPNLLASLTFNLADRANHTLPYIFVTSVSSIQDLKSKLTVASLTFGTRTPKSPKPVIIVFGGQESDFIGLSEAVYQSSKVFRSHLDRCDQELVSKGQESFYPTIFRREAVENLITLHSSLFAVQYASAMAWMDSGLEIDGVVGHSFGQLTAFCISGALSLSDALTLVVGRASLMQKYWGPERGSMLFLQADRTIVEHTIQWLEARNHGFDVEIACYNGPKSHVVVGSSEAISSLEQHIANTPSLHDKVPTKRLKVTHGFHSKFTEPVLPHLEVLATKLNWRIPTFHLETCDDVSSVTEPNFDVVSKHTRRPVFFQQAVERLAVRFPQATWIEAGRGSSVMRLVNDSLPNLKEHTLLAPQLAYAHAQRSLVDVTISLWMSGYAAQFWAFHRSQKPEYEYLSLPPYQFEKIRHWLPFLGRTLQNLSKAEEEAEEENELFSFIRFNDDSEKEALFRVNSCSKRFQSMLGGHVMGGQALAPASLYFELVARAALFLHNDPDANEYVPAVDDLLMKSPIGRDVSTEITLTLKRMDNRTESVRPSWSFSIVTKAVLHQGGEPSECSTGTVCLKKRDEARAAREFRQLESVTGYRRCNELLNHPNAETMQGNHIYRAFSTVVHYGKPFQGIKKVACVRHEAAGEVVITPDITAPAGQRLCDTPMTDSFMQFAGFLVNYFNNASLEDVFVCTKIGHIEIGGNFNPDVGKWVVYSNMSANEATSDAYVFEARSQKMVMAAFGFHFTKMPQGLLTQLIQKVNSNGTSELKPPTHIAQAIIEKTTPLTPDVSSNSTGKPSSRKPVLLQILSDVTDVPLENIKGDSTLEELGIDSLMATEVLNDIRATLGLTIDLTTLLFFPKIDALFAHVDRSLGISNEEAGIATPSSPSTDHDITDISHPLMTEAIVSKPLETFDKPIINSAFRAFEETRLGYDELAKGTKAVDFWSGAYPPQARLVLAYVVEAFAQLGCDLNSLHSGDPIPPIQVLKRHRQLLRQLLCVLEDGKLVISTDKGFFRSDIPIDETPAESIYQRIIGLFPQHDDANKLVRAVGSEMAACLVGEQDGLQVVFGNKETKRTLEALYEFWPLFRTPTLVLGNFLVKALANATGGGKFHILEVGAGTGGTTRYIVDHLRNHGIAFEYVFTDISTSLVAAARKQFAGVDGMSFEVLDIEKSVRLQHKGAFHCIIATNCIHVSKCLEASLSRLRKMLRKDGVLTLIEVTKNMFWLDIVVGLFEGWWSFEDGRSHALVDEQHWRQVLNNSGFSEVLWSDGATPESKTVRVIGAFPRGDPIKMNDAPPTSRGVVKTSLETVVYKRIGDQEIHADIYYPAKAGTRSQKLPIALMIHGGSHTLFSRKDIRPFQTHLLLEKGFLPVSLDHRLCPEASLSEGPMVDVCDALYWARHTLPHIPCRHRDLHFDGERVVVVGWSSGGQLAMSLAWTAPQIGLRPPEAVLAFYSPTNYEDEWWTHPIQPIGAEDKGEEYDILEAVQNKPITNYDAVSAWEPLSNPRILTDPRCRIVLHMNWKAQTLPIIMGGLPSKSKAAQCTDIDNWNALPLPGLDKIAAASALSQIRRGNYQTPTFLIHGTADELIPWQQSLNTYEAMIERDIAARLVLVPGAPHICDLSNDPNSEGWKAVVEGYDFLSSYV